MLINRGRMEPIMAEPPAEYYAAAERNEEILKVLI